MTKKARYETDPSEMDAADRAVVAACGAEYEQLRKFAALAAENPAARAYAERQAGKVLDAMPPAQRIALRRALANAMKRGGRR